MAKAGIWKAAVPLAMMVGALLIIGRSADYARSTELLTWSFGAHALAFVIGFAAAAVILWVTRHGWKPVEASDDNELKIGCVFLALIMLWGFAGTAIVDQWVEARAFGDAQFELTRAKYPIASTDDGRRRGRYRWLDPLFGRDPNRIEPTITVSDDEAGISGTIPVPAALVEEAGNVRDDSLLEQKCLTLYIQQSGGTIRSVVRDADGTMLDMEVGRCNPGPPPRATTPF